MGDGRVGPGEQPQAEHHSVHRTLIQESSLGTSQLAPVLSFRAQERRGELGDEKRERETNSETGRPGVYFTPLALLPRDTRKRPGLNHHREPSLSGVTNVEITSVGHAGREEVCASYTISLSLAAHLQITSNIWGHLITEE